MKQVIIIMQEAHIIIYTTTLSDITVLETLYPKCTT